MTPMQVKCFSGTQHLVSAQKLLLLLLLPRSSLSYLSQAPYFLHHVSLFEFQFPHQHTNEKDLCPSLAAGLQWGEGEQYPRCICGGRFQRDPERYCGRLNVLWQKAAVAIFAST